MCVNPLIPVQAVVPVDSSRYAKVIEVSKRVRWEIERDVIRGRQFDFSRCFLPNGLSLVDGLPFLGEADRRLYSQIQGRTYAHLFGMAERFIGAKMLDTGRQHWFGDQLAAEAAVRFTDEELKHQALFRRMEGMIAPGMPPGYRAMGNANAVAKSVLGKATWAVLAFTLHIERFTEAHYRASIAPDADICPLWKDVFLFHWKEESQHTVMDELEFQRENARVDEAGRDAGLTDLIALIQALDGMLRLQASADAQYLLDHAERAYAADEQQALRDGMLKAYRWQYLVSGAMEPRFRQVLSGMLNAAQAARFDAALRPLAESLPGHAALSGAGPA